MHRLDSISYQRKASSVFAILLSRPIFLVLKCYEQKMYPLASPLIPCELCQNSGFVPLPTIAVPTTEGDLGDGIAPYAAFRAANLPLSIGSDSNTRLDPFEELRWAEYSARMRYQRRRILVADELSSPGPLLLNYGTRSGAMALDIEAGIIAPGMSADFIAVDINHPAIAGWTANDFLDTLFFGASSEVIMQTWVQGKRAGA